MPHMVPNERLEELANSDRAEPSRSEIQAMAKEVLRDRKFIRSITSLTTNANA